MLDVVVIGSGLAGSIAALMARAAGAKVGIATRSWGATALATGAFDIAYSPGLIPAHGGARARSLADHLRDIITHRPRHPYGVLGAERSFDGLRQGFALLGRALADSALATTPLDLDRANDWLPSALGALVPAGAALTAHGPLSGRVGLVQLLSDAGFDAERVRAGLVHDAAVHGLPAPELTVRRVESGPGVSPLALARRFDDIAEIDCIAAGLRGKLEGLDALLMPPVLGLRRHALVRSALAEKLGLPVLEALGRAPSVPGVRLQLALEAALGRAGIQQLGEVVAPVVAGRSVRALTTRDQLEVSAGSFVLASGKFIAGGIVWDERCREALFGLPVVTELGPIGDDNPDPVVRETPMESHPLLTAGVQVDERLHPLAEGGRAFDNLFAASMVLGGFASRYTLCADGVALASGVIAAQGALHVAGSGRSAVGRA